jgi:hypothetical protein
VEEFLNQLKKALALLLRAGYTPKEISLQVGVSLHTVYRSDPQIFATARRSRAKNGKKIP